MKDFAGWEAVKRKRDADTTPPPYFHEREVWWVALGINIGFEEDGKGPEYARPVLIARKFNARFFYGVPLSTTDKRGVFYYPFSYKPERTSVALLSQARALDARRLIRKDGMAPHPDFAAICEGVAALFRP